MYLIKISSSLVSSLARKMAESQEGEDFYEALKKGERAIYYRFSPVDKNLFYGAVGPSGKTVALNVDAGRNIVVYNLSPEEAALAYFLHEKESSLSEGELKNIYGANYPILAPFAKLSEQDAQRKNFLTPVFDRLEKQLQELRAKESSAKEKCLGPKQTVKLEFGVEVSSDGDRYLISGKAGYKSTCKIPDLFAFVTKIPLGTEVKIPREGMVPVTLDSFSAQDQECLKLLSKEGKQYFGYYERKGDVSLTSGPFCRFLLALQGKSILYYDKAFQIDDKVNALSFSVGEEGALSHTPLPEGDRILGENGLAVMNRKKGKILFYRFESEQGALLYRFLRENPSFRFDLFQDEMSSRILPYLDDKVSVSEAFQEKHPYKKPKIRYSIDYLEGDKLSFQTDYFFGKEEAKLEDFLQDGIASSLDSAFQARLSELKLPERGETGDESEILRFLSLDLGPLGEVAEVYVSDNLASKKVKRLGQVKAKASSGIDWLEVSLSSEEYGPEELDAILRAFKKKRKFVRLGDSLVSLEGEEELEEFAEDFPLEGVDTGKVPIYQALKLASYQKGQVKVDFTKELKDLLGDIKNFKKEKLPLPPTLESCLRPYQKEGVQWLHVLSRRGLSGILADDMGLGKSFEMISLLSLSQEKKPILIVAPKSLLYNWEAEFRRWDPAQPVLVLSGDKVSREKAIAGLRGAGKLVCVISYDSLRGDLPLFEGISFSYLILDEGQAIANAYAKKSQSVKKIEAEHRFVLTGTPIQNSLLDLWSIFDFLMPGYLPSLETFRSEVSKGKFESGEGKKSLMAKITPFVLKRSKEEVLKDLPPKTEMVSTLLMDEKQKELYDAYRQKAKESLSAEKGRIEILAALTRLRELCVDPSLFFSNYDGGSAKTEEAIRLVKEAIGEGHKVLLFSSFAEALHSLQAKLKEEGVASYLIDGQVDAKTRLKEANAFNGENGEDVMLVSLKAGGTGLNLIGADTVIHLDPWWNLAAEKQASDRAHRIGQTKKVTVIKLICKDSVEEKVLLLQEKKKELASVIQEGGEAISSMNLNDLKYLLSD